MSAPKISKAAERVARILWPGSIGQAYQWEFEDVSTAFHGCSLYAKPGSDDAAYFHWLYETARHLHCAGNYWACQPRAGAA